MNIFRRFLTPKWKHKNSEIRKKAILELVPGEKESQTVYAQVALNDSDNELRVLAIRRLISPDIVQQVINDCDNDRVKTVACHRLRQLLASADIDLDKFLEVVRQTADENLLEIIAESSSNAELRKAALERVERQSFLGDVAINDDNAEIRLFALSKITQRSTLSRVAKKSKTKDKKISALAKERVAELVAKEQQPERLVKEAKQCAKDLSSLVQGNKKSNQWEKNSSRYETLLSKWQELLQQWDSGGYGEWNRELGDRFEQLCNEYSTNLAIQREKEAKRRAYEAEHAPLRAEISEMCATLETMVSDYSGKSHPDFDDAKVIAQYLKKYMMQWRELQGKAPEDTALYSLRFEQACDKLSFYKKEIEIYAKAEKRLLDLLKKISAEQSSQQLDLHRIDDLEKKFNELTRPVNFKLDKALIDSVIKGLQDLRNRFKQQMVDFEKNATAFESLMDEIGVALEQGEIRRAAALVSQGRKRLAKLPENGFVSKQKRRRFQRYTIQVSELKNWHDWSSLPVKERLCKEMEQLADEVEKNSGNSNYDLGEVARLVKVARDEWKTTGASDDKKIWERFNSACSRAYEPCKEYFETQAQQRQKNLQLKEAVCDGLEEYAKLQELQLEQDNVDWVAAEKIIRTAQKEWNEIGHVERKHLREINRRFRKVMNLLRSNAKAHRAENRNKKLQLIRQAEDIRSDLNEEKVEIDQAVSLIKQIQAEWKSVGHALDDRSLWQGLRAVCDDIFARRDAKNEKLNQEHLNNLTAKEILCDEIESLANSGENLDIVYKTRFKELKDKWHDLGNVPKENIKPSQLRFEKVCRLFEDSHREYLAEQKRHYRNSLRLQHNICGELEMLLSGVVDKSVNVDLSDTILAMDEKWQQLKKEKTPAEDAIALRYTTARKYLDRYRAGEDIADEIKALQQTNLSLKKELCLRLEVLAGVDSPQEFKQDRIQYQVAIMADEMKSGEKQDKKTALSEIEDSWYATGFIDKSLHEQFEKRFFGILGSIEYSSS